MSTPEQDLLDQIFDTGRYKNRYKVRFCDMCDIHYLICPDCNGGGCSPDKLCDLCREDIEYFNSNVKSVCSYLTRAEQEAIQKARHVKKLLKESHDAGRTEIDWEYVGTEGKSCKRDEDYFPILKQYPYKFLLNKVDNDKSDGIMNDTGDSHNGSAAD